MKKQFFIISLFCASWLMPEAAKMPSVADVFGNMSEDEITQQVKLGQQFLEDLEKYGSPEEKAQFEQLLLETLNSMSETDFDDIQNIAKMVEPHLDIPQETTPITTIQPAAKEEVVAPKASQDDTETFKTLINTITQRIDDIFQKFSSSKECTEEVNARWKSKATFNNMKRQIAQLKNNRLAQKLSKKDLNDEDRALVEMLTKFHKDLTEQNDGLVIEDDFGLPSSRDTEQKHLKKAKSILDIFDGYIDGLMPKLEKFLLKWDPEALQLAKEAEERTSKAIKSAQDAQIRRPSADARAANNAQQNYPSPVRPGGFDNPYPDYIGGYPEDYGNPYSEGGFSGTSGKSAKSDAEGSQPGQSAKQPQDAKKAIMDNNKAKSSGAYEDISDAFDDHLNAFGPKHEQKFIDFLNKDMLNLKVTDVYNAPADQPLTQPDSVDWLNKSYQTYKTSMLNSIKNDFSKEFRAASDVLDDTNKVIREMDPEALKKTSNLNGITALTTRYNNYKQNIETTKKKLQENYNINFNLLGDFDAQKRYEAEHTDFMNQFKADVEDKVENVLDELGHIQRKIRRQASRKKTSDTNSVPAPITA